MSTFTRESLQDLLAHVAWADDQVWNAVLVAPRAHDDVGIRDYLHHIHLVQGLFLALWTGGSPGLVAARQPSEFTLMDLRAWGSAFYAEAAAFLASATPAQLDQPLVAPWVARLEEQMSRKLHTPTVAETVFQVVNHTTHHRAQVSTRLRAAGGEPPLVDYIAWVWFGRPGPSSGEAEPASPASPPPLGA